MMPICFSTALGSSFSWKLKWCGSAPFYTFLKAAPKSKGEVLQSEQWNIDPQSVVSFEGMAFRK